MKKNILYIISRLLLSNFFCSARHHLYSLDTVSEEVRFVCMHNDYVKKVSPIFSHHVCHSFVSAHRKRIKKKHCNRTVHPSHESEWSLWVTDSQHLHKAKRAVGDEEEFLALTNQSIQNSLSFFASQDELVCGEEEDRMLFNV